MVVTALLWEYRARSCQAVDNLPELLFPNASNVSVDRIVTAFASGSN